MSQPLLLGGVSPLALWALVGLSFLTLGCATLGAHRERHPTSFPTLALIPLLGGLACLVQLVPLPPAILKLLSPPAHELREVVLVPLGLTGFRPLSLDPPSTLRELAKHVSYLAVLLSAFELGRSALSRRRVLWAVAGTAMGVAVLGLLHELFAAESLLGFYRFQLRPPLLSTFGNPNHLAGYLMLGASVTLGLLLTTTDRPKALGLGVGYLLCGTAIFLSLSRGGIVFFVFSQLLLGTFVVLQRRKADGAGTGRLSRALWAVVAVASVVCVSGYVAYEKLAAEWATADSVEELRASKVEAWWPIWNAVRPFQWVGMGRGAFEWAFTRHQAFSPHVTYTHPENLVLQWVSEWGVPLSVALLLIGFVTLWRQMSRHSWDELDAAVWASAIGLFLHNLFDFNLEFSACAATLTAMVGLVLKHEEQGSLLHLGFRKAAAAAAVGLAVALVALWQSFPSVPMSEKRLAEAMAKKPPGDVRQKALETFDRHPANFAQYVQMGVFEIEQGRPREALAHVNRALYLRPIDGHSHLVAARALVQLGQKKHSFLQYRLAYQAGVTQALEEGLRQANSLEEWTALVPTEPDGILNLLWRLRPKDPEGARAVLNWALDQLGDRADSEALWRMDADFRLGQKDFEGALASLERAEGHKPDNVEAAVARSSVWTEMGFPEKAVESLTALSTKKPEHVELAFSLATLLLGQGRFQKAREALTRISPFVAHPDHRIRLLLLEAGSFEREQRYAKALVSYQGAKYLQPDRADLHYHTARMLEQVGRYAEALNAVQAGLRRDVASAEKTHLEWMERLSERERQRAFDRDKLLLETPTSPEAAETP